MNSWSGYYLPYASPYPGVITDNVFAGYRFPNGQAPVSPPQTYKSQQDALALIERAVQGEREDELFYDYLISVAPGQEEKAIIASIRDDERKHNRMFRTIYKDLTGRTLPPAKDGSFQKPESYTAGLTQALFGELGAVEKYRDIRAGMPNRYYRDMVFEILTDEQKHADKYNFLLNHELRRKSGR
ncbi:ferritin-like domain-containing protein [Paenibacillus contaminans]|uniref:Ferritin-like domain-containing protein n=1 Tax=Paenibacillus contaminans TaxID=450362 RepID=A0A329LTT7_9BACL|nr:ferritin-like domain-containing protein [Paenibacillus contaminans]RAV10808.1 ferritin-like domain-containing protein [Paenibacillus contaminans]